MPNYQMETLVDLRKLFEKLKNYTNTSPEFIKTINEIRALCQKDEAAKKTVNEIILGYGHEDFIGFTRLGPTTGILLSGALGDITGAYNFTQAQKSKEILDNNNPLFAPENKMQWENDKIKLIDHIVFNIEETISKDKTLYQTPTLKPPGFN